VSRRPIVLVLAVANLLVFALVSAELVAGIAPPSGHPRAVPAAVTDGRADRHGWDSGPTGGVARREASRDRRAMR
jgi:hypothetical protein